MKISYCLKILLLISIFTFFSKSNALALDIVTRENLMIDEQLINEESITYSQPQKIYVSQVKGFDSKLSNEPSKWVKLLYYYSVTRLKLSDVPYNYLIDESGTVYEGRNGGAGSNPSLNNEENIVLVGYLSSKDSLTPRASDTLKKLVEELSYKYGIKDRNFQTVSLSITKKDGNFSYMQATPVSASTFSESVGEALADVQLSQEEHLQYKGSVQSVEYSKDVVIGEVLKVTIKFKNENDFTWLADPNYIYISTIDSKDSQYAVNSVWDSFSKPTHVSQTFVKPGDTVELSFDMLAKSKPGTYTAEFNFIKSPNTVFENSNFKVEFNITAGDYKLVEMSSPEYGFVNIRSCRWYSCEKVEVANNGDVFVTTNKEEGWYEVEYKKGSKGWVYQKYVREL